jgi:hypothetical protein
MKEFDPFKTPVRNDAGPSNNKAIFAFGVLTIVTLAALVLLYLHKKQQEDIKAMK